MVTRIDEEGLPAEFKSSFPKGTHEHPRVTPEPGLVSQGPTLKLNPPCVQNQPEVPNTLDEHMINPEGFYSKSGRFGWFLASGPSNTNETEKSDSMHLVYAYGSILVNIFGGVESMLHETWGGARYLYM